MADGDYERREPKTAELRRLERIIAAARPKTNCQIDAHSAQFKQIKAKVG